MNTVLFKFFGNQQVYIIIYRAVDQAADELLHGVEKVSALNE